MSYGPYLTEHEREGYDKPIKRRKKKKLKCISGRVRHRWSKMMIGYRCEHCFKWRS